MLFRRPEFTLVENLAQREGDHPARILRFDHVGDVEIAGRYIGRRELVTVFLRQFSSLCLAILGLIEFLAVEDLDRGLGAVINNSRGILFAYRDGRYAQEFGETRWQAAVEAATRRMIDELYAETPAARLRDV